MEPRLAPGKYLTFDLNGQRYGVDAMRVVTIIGMEPCTPLPQAPRHVKGLTMVRGKVIPVIDTRVRLGMPEAEETPETCIAILSVGAGQTGIVVDMVQDVLDITGDQLDDKCDGLDSDDYTGVAKLGDRIITLLDVDQIAKFQ